MLCSHGKAQSVCAYLYRFECPFVIVIISDCLHYVWGANISFCPAHDYVWTAKKPNKFYEAYREGLDELRKLSTELASG